MVYCSEWGVCPMGLDKQTKEDDYMKAKKLVLAILTTLLIFAAIPLTTMAATIRMSPATITLEVGEVYKLKVLGTAKKKKWSSSRKKVATVNAKGVVTAKKKGTTMISAKVGGKTVKCKVKVVNITGVWAVLAGVYKTQYNLAKQFIQVKDLVDDAYWRHEGSVWRIYAGSFYDRQLAIARRNYLQYYGIDAVIEYE